MIHKNMMQTKFMTEGMVKIKMRVLMTILQIKTRIQKDKARILKEREMKEGAPQEKKVMNKKVQQMKPVETKGQKDTEMTKMRT